MADFVTSAAISGEFWDLLHRMGLPRELTKATIILEANEPIRVNADFYLTAENGGLQLIEDAIATASANFVIVRADEIAPTKE